MYLYSTHPYCILHVLNIGNFYKVRKSWKAKKIEVLLHVCDFACINNDYVIPNCYSFAQNHGTSLTEGEDRRCRKKYLLLLEYTRTLQVREECWQELLKIFDENEVHGTTWYNTICNQYLTLSFSLSHFLTTAYTIYFTIHIHIRTHTYIHTHTYIYTLTTVLS